MLDSDTAVTNLIGEALENSAELVVVPIERFPSDFLQLRSRVAGNLLQKFVNYRLRLAIIGDLTEPMSRSQALQAFVAESNRGEQIWFLPSISELGEKLS
jgi:hypothetical protein